MLDSNTPPQVRINGGYWLSGIGWWGDLVVTHRWPFGCWSAEWSMNLPENHRPPVLRAGALVEVMHAGTPVWVGRLAEPDWSQQRFHADGLAREAEHALAFDGSGNVTSVPNTAVDAAISRGALSWVREQNISSNAFADFPTDTVNYVAALLDAWTVENGMRWAVGPDRRVIVGTDPITPTWYILPDSGVLGVASEETVSHVFARYRTGTGTFATVSVSSSWEYQQERRELAVDLTPKGRLSPTRATNTANGILNQLTTRVGWANGVTVSREQITSTGGIIPSLAMVRAGQMVRFQDHDDPRQPGRYVDVVIGETVWNVNDGTITLNPVGLAERDLAKVVESSGGVLAS